MKSLLNLCYLPMFVSFTFLAGIESTTWNYNDIPGWGRVSQLCNTGSRQSPIEINLEKATFSKEMLEKPIEFENFNRGRLCGSLENTGHSVQWTMVAANTGVSESPRITGFQFGKNSYLLEQLHFHWGDLSNGGRCQGAEHLLDYKSSPMEMHLVHFNSKFESVAQAQDKEDGLAVVAFQFEPTQSTKGDDDDDPFQSDYDWLVDKITDGSLESSGSSVELCLSSLSQVVPLQLIEGASNVSMYTYRGSLTTPSCYESVTWTLFQSRIILPQWQIDAIRNGSVLKTVEGTPMVNNYRPIQPTNGRPIWTNFLKNSATSSQHYYHPSWCWSTIHSSFFFFFFCFLLSILSSQSSTSI